MQIHVACQFTAVYEKMVDCTSKTACVCSICFFKEYKHNHKNGNRKTKTNRKTLFNW